MAVCGIPGSLLAGYMVEITLLGRRGTLSISTSTFILISVTYDQLIDNSVLTGIFILASTTARSSNSLLAWNCAYSFASNIMYGVLYAMTPELFPTKHRGTGNSLTATANRVFGVMVYVLFFFRPLQFLKFDLLSGTSRSAVCKPYDLCSDLYRRRCFLGSRCLGVAPSFRIFRQSVTLMF